MIEYWIEIETTIPPIQEVFERLKEYLIEEFHFRDILEYSAKPDPTVLLYCRIYLEGNTFKVHMFDGIVIGELTIDYDDIIIRYKIKNAMHKFIDAYYEECNGLSATMLAPRHDYYRSKGVLK